MDVRGPVLVFAALFARAPAPPATGARAETTLVVLARDVAPGEVLTAADLAEIEFPADLVPDAVLRDQDDIVGRRTNDRILAGEPVRPERLVPAWREQYPATAVVRVPVVTFPAELSVGSFVEVLATRDGATRAVHRGARVLGIDADAVALEIAPHEQAAFDAAVRDARLVLALRADADVTHIETHGTFAPCRLQQTCSPPPPRPPKGCVR